MSAYPQRFAADTAAAVRRALVDWYGENARALPWREPATTPWGVLVSEVMSHQTPVARVAPIWCDWLERWPDPAALAATAPGDVVRAWGALGYPRRALRLRECAQTITTSHGGQVPPSYDTLLSLPGVGPYTAAAVSAFAFGHPVPVVDTNVRRVLARIVTGSAPATPTVTAGERRLAADLLPVDRSSAPRWSVAVMEFGALVCTARSPNCGRCPIADHCAWNRAGRPGATGPTPRRQPWLGTDRQMRGTLVQTLRESHGPVPLAALRDAAAAALDREPSAMEAQLLRCLDSLIRDGLVEPLGGEHFRLPA